MGFKKNNPGCNCCEAGCEITPITWTTDSGTWDTSMSTAPVCTAAGNIHCNEAQPDGDITMRVTGTFQIGTGSTTADIIVGWVDSTHYFYVRYTRAASGNIDIRRNNGGSHTSLATSPTININASTHTFEVCVNSSGDIVAMFNGEGKVVALAAAISGTQMGLGHSGSGTVTFGTIAFFKAYYGGVEETCEHCVEQCTGNGDVTDDACCRDTPPTDMDVTFPSDWTGIGDCALCDAISGGTYTLAYGTASVNCFLLGERCKPQWGLSIDLGSVSCNAQGVSAAATRMELRFQICCNPSPNGFTCRAEFVLALQRSSTIYAAWRWTKNYSSLMECDTLVFDLPWDGETTTGCSDAFSFCTFANSANVIVQVH